MQYIFKTREEADHVVSFMAKIIKAYSYVTVADLHDLVGMDSNYEDAQNGWKTTDKMRIEEAPEGFTLKIPAATHIVYDRV